MKTLSIASIVVTLAMASVPARAQPAEGASAYDRHMELGVRLFEDRNFDAAMTEFERAYEADERVSPLINIALCHKGRFEYVKAVRVLEGALARHRGATDQVENIERAIKEIRELIARVDLAVQPPVEKLTVIVDGEMLPEGAAARGIELSPGTHAIAVRAEGHAEFRQDFRVSAGDHRVLEVKLVANAGFLNIDPGGPGAGVSVDGAPWGPGKQRRLVGEGAHLVVVRRGDDRYTVTVGVTPSNESAVVVDAEGLLRVGDGPARGPDEVQLPPIEGFYLFGGASAGVRIHETRVPQKPNPKTFFLFGPDVRFGYLVNRTIGVEAQVRQLFADGGFESPTIMTQAAVGIRLMTHHEPVHFATALGLGYAHDKPTPDETGFHGFHAYLEPAIEGRLGNVVLMAGVPLVFTTSAYGPGGEVGLRLQAGYGFW